MRALAALACLATLLLAGCAGDPDDPAGPAGAGGEAAAATGPVTSIAAPSWDVGQWWEWQGANAAGDHAETFCSIVLAREGGGYVLVTEHEGWAKDDAAFDHPLLGSAGSALELQGWGGPWDLLDFPLTDGKAWAGTIPNIAWDIFQPSPTVEVALTATFTGAPEAPVVAITGMAQEHRVLEAEYDSATGWFRFLRIYDVDPGQEELEIGWTAKSTGANYTGPYHQGTGQVLLAFEDRVGFSDVPTEGGQPYTQAPQPYHAFTMGEGTSLYGYVGAVSVAGARGLALVDPTNNHRLVAAPGAPEGEQFLFLDEPGQAGEWRLATAGAGGFSGAFAELVELRMTSGTFPPGPA